MIGHTLVWHNQTPPWVFQNEQGGQADRETLLTRMEEHIKTVVGRYRDRIVGWDVVNEAIADDGSMRESPWYTIIGEEYVSADSNGLMRLALRRSSIIMITGSAIEPSARVRST